MLLTTYFKEASGTGPRAEIHETSDGYTVEYYGSNGSLMKTVTHQADINTVRTIVENWVHNVSVLKG